MLSRRVDGRSAIGTEELQSPAPVVRRLHDAIRAHGFTDLREAHVAVFSYPLPDGVRPADLARQLRMSRQATNYLLGRMGALGYCRLAAENRIGRRRALDGALLPHTWRSGDPQLIVGANSPLSSLIFHVRTVF